MVAYKHPQVVLRFAKENPGFAPQAEQIFEDLMRFFWAGQVHELALIKDPTNPDLNFTYIMDEEMRSIDQMWHVFLLYTRDYMEFCDKYFGEYLHHLPDIVEKLPDDQAQFENNLEKFLNFTYDTLGEEVIKRWYAEHL